MSTIELHEALEKEVNKIYLNTLAKGILKFSNSELISLRGIAAHCPQEGGLAVHQARGMLSMVEDVDLLNFDCISSNGRSIIEESPSELEAKKEEQVYERRWDLILYPNPASNTITLESNLVLEEEIQIKIYNPLGQKVKEITINEDINRIDINVGSLLGGIYNIHLQSGAYKSTKSFIVVK
ncbi:T9SS type A sorting domain-containing protein [Aureispira anguillae]|uniref:T9SS type A sorting domain-containing protein n=1 Tax=Aureispira anguillae TaxID=2864201 RepID=A0A916DWJ0_9BACT|nr:T9SS type A sorting domain-containing protein [Aureispira anguillae]BDS14740.1 T9SS type A sorting domain-containing protein [Aureispira anguillae]